MDEDYEEFNFDDYSLDELNKLDPKGILSYFDNLLIGEFGKETKFNRIKFIYKNFKHLILNSGLFFSLAESYCKYLNDNISFIIDDILMNLKIERYYDLFLTIIVYNNFELLKRILLDKIIDPSFNNNDLFNNNNQNSNHFLDSIGYDDVIEFINDGRIVNTVYKREIIQKFIKEKINQLYLLSISSNKSLYYSLDIVKLELENFKELYNNQFNILNLKDMILNKRKQLQIKKKDLCNDLINELKKE
jgi:hypothetical protein